MLGFEEYVAARGDALLRLAYYEGYDDASIAEVLDCAASTVRSNAARGLASLRERWPDHDDDSGDPPRTAASGSDGSAKSGASRGRTR